MARKPLVLGIDAGGTMTDTFVVDENGDFTVGKAATTPHDESLGFLESAEDAMSYWELDQKALYPELEVALYSGTTMVNTLITRRGRKIGLVTTKGFEDDILMGNVEIWEMILPILYLGRRIWRDSPGAGKYRGGATYSSLLMVHKTPLYNIVSTIHSDKVFDNQGMAVRSPSSEK